MIVMKETATEEEIGAVDREDRERRGSGPSDQGGPPDRDRRDRRRRAGRGRGKPGPGGTARSGQGDADSQALQARLSPDPSRRAHRDRDRRAQARRRPLRPDRGSLHCGIERATAQDGRCRQGRRRGDVARRRLQAPHLSLRLSRLGPRGFASAGRGQGAHRPADRDRADGRARPGSRCSRWPT